MSEKFSRTGLSSGSSWSLFAENTAFEESDGVVERLGNLAESTRLHAEDVNKFGQCPSQQRLNLAVCKQCNKLLVITSVQRHYELKHSKLLGSVKPSPPKRCVPSTKTTLNRLLPAKTTYSKSKVLKSSNKSFIRIEEVDCNDTNVKIEEVPLTIPSFSTGSNKGKLSKISIKKLTSESKKTGSDKALHVNTSSPQQLCIQVKGNIKKIPQMKEKEYDVDRHCGVWIPEIERNCTRSLTCKTHPLSMRRQVPGRSKDFDDLLADHKNRIRNQDNMSNASSSPQSNSRNATPVHSPFGIDKIVFPTVPGPSSYHKDLAGSNLRSPKTFRNKTWTDEHINQNRITAQQNIDYISDDLLSNSNLPTLSYHPKPIRVNTFGGRQTDCSCRIFSRGMDHFRNATSSMLDRFTNTAFTSSKSLKSSMKLTQDGVRPAIQDPLQNGIIHKQKSKSSKLAGTKRQLSSNDAHQGIIADPLSYAASSKRRHPSEVPVVDPFTLTSQPKVIARPLSNPSQTSLHIKKEFEKPCENVGLQPHRSKSVDDFLMKDLNVSDSLNFLTASGGNDALTANFTSPSANLTVSLNSNLNLSQASGMTPTNSHISQLPANSHIPQPHHTQQISVDSTAKLIPAPNVTITQGMIVSLPNAVLQSQTGGVMLTNQVNSVLPNQTSSAYSQIKELITQTANNRTLHQLVASSNRNQVLTNTSLLTSLANGVTKSPTSEEKEYSKTYCGANLNQKEPAPNITVTVSPSLTGVLQGHAVSAVNVKPTYKRLHSSHGNEASLLQQLIVQQSNRDAHQQLTSSSYKPATNHPTNPQTSPSPKQVANNLTNIQASPRQTFINNPHQLTSGLPNNQPMQKQLQKMQIQQLQQQQIQSPQYIPMHHGYQQQILPKLPTVPQNISQFNTPQFPVTAATSNLQYISQGAATASLQQQHGGTLT